MTLIFEQKMLSSYIACIHTLVNGKNVESSYILPLYKLISSDFKVTFHYSDADEMQCLEFKKEHIRKFVEYREGEFCKFLGLYIVKTIREALKIIIELTPTVQWGPNERSLIWRGLF